MRPLLAIAVVLLASCAAEVAEPAASASPSPSPSPVPSPSVAPSSTGPSPDPGVQAGVVSERGLFVASWASEPPSPPINTVHTWVLHIDTVDGVPAAGAIVTVGGDMPAHGHGMPTQPEVTADLGGGDYIVEGMAFQMGGYWIVDVTVTFGDQTDLVRFGLDL